MKAMSTILRLLAAVLAFVAFGTACGSEDSAVATADSGVRVVTPQEGADLLADPKSNRVVLDVRTSEEFAEGHVEGAVMIDFYQPDFAEQIAGLDRDGSYLLYCRSGNRSEQARTLMADLGFSDVADVEGGIVAWTEAGLPIVR